MDKFRSILVAVKHLQRRRNPVIERAALIAAASGAKLELFHDLSSPVYVDTVMGANSTLASLTRASRAEALARLEALAAPLRATGLAVATAAVWDYPPYEAIVRRAQATGADLIVTSKQGHHRLPALMGYTDWELLRICPVPVLLVKGTQRSGRGTVLAAVDPQHAFDKPAALDAKILTAAAALAPAYRARVHAVHVLAPWSHAGLGGQALSTDLEGMGRRMQRAARAALAQVIASTGVKPARTHLLAGQPDLELPAASRRLRATLVVMGAMSRRGLKRLFPGNTAERLLDKLSCDVLIVKPAHFEARLPRRRRGFYFLAGMPLARPL
jgi:universal stress protein E